MSENQIEISVIQSNSVSRKARSWEEYAQLKNLKLIDIRRLKTFDIVIMLGEKDRIVVIKGKESKEKVWVKSLIAFSKEELLTLREMLEKIEDKLIEQEAREIIEKVRSNRLLLEKLKEILSKQ